MANKNDFIAPATPSEDVATTPFDLSHNNSLSARLGVPYPCFLYDAPGHSSFEIVPSSGFDMMPLASPIQTNIRQHIKFYKIPKRILWKDYRAWHVGHGNFVKPYIHRTNRFNVTGSLADYMNLPTFYVHSERSDVVEEWSDYRYVSGDVVLAAVGSDPIRLFSRVPDAFAGVRSKAFNHAIYKGIVHSSIRSRELLSFSNPLRLAYRFFKAVPSPYYNGHPSTLYDEYYEPLTDLVALPFSADPGAAGKFWIDDLNRDASVMGQTLYETGFSFALTASDEAVVNDAISKGQAVFCLLCWNLADVSLFGDPNGELVVPPRTASMPVAGEYVKDDVTGDTSLNLQFGMYRLGVTGHYNYIAVVDITHGGEFAFNPLVAANASTPPLLPVCALPFRAYEFIGNYFFRNLDIDPFIKPGESEPAFDEYISTDESGADTLTPLEFFKIPAEYDLFTTCMKSPSFGQAPLVRITSYDADDTEGTRSIAVLHMAPEGQNPYNITVTFDRDSQEITAVESSPSDADKTPVHLIKDGLKYGISIQDFMSVSALQRFQDRMQRVIHGHGSKYYNYVREFYGTNPPIGEEFPEYLGGFNSNIEIGKNKAMASNPDADEKLGDFNGSGFIGGQGKKIKCFCSEDCYVLGIVYFTTSFTMSQCLDRHWTKTHYLEDLNPQFTNVIPQPVYKHQIAPLQLTAETLYDVFGFNVPYAEYRQMFDEAHGNYRGNMQHYIIQRLFGNAPQLNKQFIYLDDEQFTDVFEDTSEDDKIFGMIHFDVKAVLPMPRYEIPKIR